MSRLKSVLLSLGHQIVFLLGLALILTLIFSFSLKAKAADIVIDLVPEEVEEELCESLESGTEGILSCGVTEEVTSFTQFQGEFAPPEEEGYAAGLTRATSAREFILNVTNFALAFLGLIAVLMIIYAGILLVTAGGSEQQTGKGKKIILYSVLGLVVVLGSYALVNTIITQAPVGGEDRPGGGGIYSVGVTGEEVTPVSVNEVAVELQAITKDFVSNYVSYTNINNRISQLENVSLPAVEETSGVVTNEDEILNALNQISQYLSQIQDEVDPFSNTYEKGQEFSNYLNQYLTSAFTKTLAKFENWVKANVLLAAITSDYSGYDSDLEDYLSDLEKANQSDYDEKIEKYQDAIEDLEAFFEDTALEQIKDQFESVKTNLGKANSISITAQVLRNVVADLGTLYSLVENLDFVTARITASVAEGNAPLIVNFNGLQSSDPSEVSITDDRYQWDFDGDGEFDDGTGASTSYTFDEAGSYRVKLKADSADPNIASGLSYLTVKVHPPSSKIVLTARPATAETTVLVNHTTIPQVDKDSFKVTLSEAGAGITFDASASRDGNDNPLVYYEWTFGDYEKTQGTESLITHAYGQEGKYELILQVTDQTGILDREIIYLNVASPAARISVSPEEGDLETVFAFDAGGSKTDVGSIASYLWDITKDGVSVFVKDNTEETFNHQFETPGVYQISLVATDSTGKQDRDSIEIMIESNPPVAKFTWEIPNSKNPAAVYLDASSSYDPDPDDVLTYTWDLGGEEGKDFEFLEGTNANFVEPIVKFYEKDDYQVTLTVNDQYTDETLRQEDSAEETISIESVLDVNLEITSGKATHLNETGQAEVSFLTQSEHAVAFEIDFGEGTTEVIETISEGEATLTHSYSEAGVYQITLTAFDEEDNENTAASKVYIGGGEGPIAVIAVSVDGQALEEAEIEANRSSTFTFDASGSINKDGSSRRLSYSWNFGDGKYSTQKTTTRKFEEKGTFEVSLTVKDKDDPVLSSEDKITVTIAGLAPEIHGLTAVPEQEELTTPVKVKVEADAEDPDGKITQYLFWYYDQNESATELGGQISFTNSITLTLNTKGEEGEEITYGFGVKVTDDENNSLSSEEVLIEEEIPALTVVNGPNKTPVAQFTVDRSSIYVGESVNFLNGSYDPDGEIVEYIWDFEGDGFSDNEKSSTPSVSHTFTEMAKEGIEVRLKVEDNGGSTAISDPVKIYVDTLTTPPEAAFTFQVKDKTVTFTNKSSSDEEAGVTLDSFKWDFDLSEDSNGNGKRDDDEDSKEKSPSYTYEDYRTYQVKLTVIDSEGTTDEVIQTVTLEKPKEESLVAYLTTSPEASVSDGKVHLTGDSGNVTFTFSASGYLESVTFCLDKNIYYDSDGDGKKDNDCNYTAAGAGSWITDFKKEWGMIVVKLTVEDEKERTDYVTKEIVFDQSSEVTAGSTNIFPVTPTQGFYLLVTAFSFAILGTGFYFSYRKRKNGK